MRAQIPWPMLSSEISAKRRLIRGSVTCLNAGSDVTAIILTKATCSGQLKVCFTIERRIKSTMGCLGGGLHASRIKLFGDKVMVGAAKGATPVFSGACHLKFGGCPKAFPITPIFGNSAPLLSGGHPGRSSAAPTLLMHGPLTSGGRPVLSESAPFSSGVSPFFQISANVVRTVLCAVRVRLKSPQKSAATFKHRPYAHTCLGRNQSAFRPAGPALPLRRPQFALGVTQLCA